MRARRGGQHVLEHSAVQELAPEAARDVAAQVLIESKH